MIEDIRKSVLPNGIRVVSESIPTVESIALGLWFNVGSRDETPPQRGIAHFLEHMLFKGTARRPTPKAIADEMDAIGGYLNAFTDKEMTCYYARALSEHLPVAADILSDMAANSLLDPVELAKERGVVLEEIKGRDDDPEDLVHDVFGECIHPGHPLGLPVIGTAATVSGLTSEDLRSFLQQRYTAGNLVVAASGNLDHSELCGLIQEALGHLPAGSPRESLPPPKARPGAKEVSRPTEQVHFCIGMDAVSQDDPARYPLALLDNILGGSMGARLFQEIREKRGLAYTVGSYANLHHEGGTFAAYAGTSRQHYGQCVEVILDEFDKIRRNSVTRVELERAKMQFRVSVVMGQESMSNRMNRIGKSECAYGRVLPLDEILSEIDKVTVDDVAELAERIFPQERDLYSMAAIGPFSDADQELVSRMSNDDETEGES